VPGGVLGDLAGLEHLHSHRHRIRVFGGPPVIPASGALAVLGAVRGRRTVRSRRRRRAAQRCLQSLEQPGECVRLGRRHVGEEPCEAFAERRLRRAQRPLALLRQLEPPAPAVLLEPSARQQTTLLEPGEQL